MECTYLNPVLKRGPKTSKLRRPFDKRRGSRDVAPGRETSGHDLTLGSDEVPLTDRPHTGPTRCGQTRTRRLPTSVLAPIVEIYRSRMYPVWPMIDAQSLLTQLEETGLEDKRNVEPYILTTALCAATMSQLNLAPVGCGPDSVDSAYMERECSRIRNSTNYREHPSTEGVLTSFFLHVYHAKVDSRNSAWMFLQEAISLARLLHLDDVGIDANQSNHDYMDQQKYQSQLIYLLLWVSERGYAIQHDLRACIQETINLPLSYFNGQDIYAEGLIELGSLFVAFDSSFCYASHLGLPLPLSDKQLLVTVHHSLITNVPRPFNYDPVRRADYFVTKQWMKVLLWQQAMSRGLLSSVSDAESLTFLFPSRIAQDLLSSIATISKNDLLPLGRDQLVKFFEVTNSLADVILCAPAASISAWSHRSSHSLSRECCRYGPADFLHGLFQTISPFLKDDKRLNDMLSQKAAEALLRAPSRIIPESIGGSCLGSAWNIEDETGESGHDVTDALADVGNPSFHED